LIWNSIESSPVKIDNVKDCTEKVIKRLDENVFRVRFNRLTSGEKTFLRMMANFGKGPYKLADIATEFSLVLSNLSTVSAKLIKKNDT